jgi:WhiB family redox-sensing transcriptional regulator
MASEHVRSDWRHHAECLDEDPELFFPIGNTGPALEQIEDAKAVWRRCDMADMCRGWALETGQDAGVWGGLSEYERRALTRRRRSGAQGSLTAEAAALAASTVTGSGPACGHGICFGPGGCIVAHGTHREGYAKGQAGGADARRLAVASVGG